MGIFNASIFNNAIFNTGTQATPAVETPTEQPAGRRRRRRHQLFIVKHRGEEHEFLSWEGVEAFVAEVRAEAKLEKRKARNSKRPVVRIEVPKPFQEELYRFDLPDLRPMLKALDMEAVREVMIRFDLFSMKRMIEEDENEAEAEWLLLH